MSTLPKAASLFGIAGALTLIASVLVGPPDRNDHTLTDMSLACLALAGVSILLHGVVNLWADFTRIVDPQRKRR
jgi:hypothetical protein